MNLYLRLVYTILISFWQGKAALTEEQRLSFRTWPHDLDVNLHMNNGRYLTLMDLGRVQLLIRLGIMKTVLLRLWMPVIGEAHIRFRRSLSPFQPFTLGTRILTWDDKWIYIEQRFYSQKGEVVAIGHVKGLIRSRQGNVPSRELMKLIGWNAPAPGEIPKEFQ